MSTKVQADTPSEYWSAEGPLSVMAFPMRSHRDAMDVDVTGKAIPELPREGGGLWINESSNTTTTLVVNGVGIQCCFQQLPLIQVVCMHRCIQSASACCTDIQFLLAMAAWTKVLPLLLLPVWVQMMGTERDITWHLCGTDLLRTLHFVCGDRGFYFQLGKRGENLHQAIRFFSNEPVEFIDGLQTPFTRIVKEVKFKRGIVDQCCDRKCSLGYLERYCN
ncbi:insulin-2-like [Heterodontus francisci]|uniref:insulin-2-like n=1 Tax=Heterodontus francisci TaxID=7792 RepID=UPI00355B05D9